MILLALLLSSLSWGQTDVVIGQYFHARAEAEFVEFLSTRGTTVAEASEGSEKSICSDVDEFSDSLKSITTLATKVLKDHKSEGNLWRQPSSYGDASKMLMTPERAQSYALERLRFSRLEAFARLSKLAPGCLDIFRREPSGAKNIKEIPRFRLESLPNVTAANFCLVTVRYWKELAGNIVPACKKTED